MLVVPLAARLPSVGVPDAAEPPPSALLLLLLLLLLLPSLT